MWTASEEAYLHPITLMLGAHFFWQPDKFKCKFQLYLWTHTLQFDHVHLWLPLRQLSTLKFAAQERSFHKKTQLCETSLVRTHLKPPPWEMETRWYFTHSRTHCESHNVCACVYLLSGHLKSSASLWRSRWDKGWWHSYWPHLRNVAGPSDRADGRLLFYELCCFMGEMVIPVSWSQQRLRRPRYQRGRSVPPSSSPPTRPERVPAQPQALTAWTRLHPCCCSTVGHCTRRTWTWCRRQGSWLTGEPTTNPTRVSSVSELL